MYTKALIDHSKYSHGHEIDCKYLGNITGLTVVQLDSSWGIVPISRPSVSHSTKILNKWAMKKKVRL